MAGLCVLERGGSARTTLAPAPPNPLLLVCPPLRRLRHAVMGQNLAQLSPLMAPALWKLLPA